MNRRDHDPFAPNDKHALNWHEVEGEGVDGAVVEAYMSTLSICAFG